MLDTKRRTDAAANEIHALDVLMTLRVASADSTKLAGIRNRLKMAKALLRGAD